MPVFAITDLELMQTAGMDSLILNWTNSLGIQIFGPLTIIGMAARESLKLPLNRCCPACHVPTQGGLPEHTAWMQPGPRTIVCLSGQSGWCSALSSV